MKAICGLILVLCTLPTFGQNLLHNLKRAAEEKARTLANENLNKAGEAMMKNLEKERAEFDSTDFDYAILLSDNSGLFDVREKGETKAKISSLASLTSSFYKNTEFTDEERARFNLESGEIMYGLGKFSMAEKKFDAARKVYEDAGLHDHIGYLKTIANQGLLYTTMGRFTNAEVATIEALELRKDKLGETNLGVAASLNNYGVLQFNLGRYNESEKSLAEALNIAHGAGMSTTMPHAIIRNNQAMLFQAIGRYDEAVTVLKEAISVAEKLQSRKSKNHLKFMSNLALLYQQMGRYSEADEIYNGMERGLGKNSPDYASVLLNQAALHMVMGKGDNVESLLKRAAEIFRSRLGSESPAYAKSISDLGNFYRHNARYAEAEPPLVEALSLREKILGVNHPLYVQSQEDLAILYWKNQQPDKAYVLYQEAMNKSLDFINRYFAPMSEAEKTKYWDILAPRFQRFYNFALETAATHSAILGDLYDYHIATKALLLSSTNKVKRSIFSSGDGELIRTYVAWLDQKEQLARLYAYSKEEIEQQKINLDSIERATNAMEKRLSERSSVFSEGYDASRISFRTISALLGEQEAVVEIIRMRPFEQTFTSGAHYVALVLTKGSTLPTAIVLNNGDQLESRYSRFYRNAIQQKIEDPYSYNQYWEPLESALQGKKTIYISPDGVYNQLNLNTLSKPGAGFVLDHYDLVILSNSKDLLSLGSRAIPTGKKVAVLLGAPDYGGSALTPLPGTKAEVDAIAKLLTGTGYQVNPLTGTAATESGVKAVNAPALLHIATHGYFLADVEKESSGFGVHIDNAAENPLLRSGLMLANASKTITGAATPDLQSNDNGVLTAYEAMNLNLDKTQLVVLSACETGLGEIKAGEGVYGLQRAFLVAGAEALIMSLWKVDDAATQLLMTSFYRNLIRLNDKQKAFKQAQLDLMSKYKEPYYWGAFVMIGK